MGKKSSGKGRNNDFYIHTNIVTQKRVGEKRAKQVFQKHTNSASKKCWVKDRREKGRKKDFYIHTNIITKNAGKKSAKQFFQKHTNSASKKCRKTIIGKKCEKSFLYSHEYREPKGG